jgi:hypothetical protein
MPQRALWDTSLPLPLGFPSYGVSNFLHHMLQPWCTASAEPKETGPHSVGLGPSESESDLPCSSDGKLSNAPMECIHIIFLTTKDRNYYSSKETKTPHRDVYLWKNLDEFKKMQTIQEEIGDLMSLLSIKK